MTAQTPPPSESPAPGFRRGRRVADEMTPDYLAFVESANAAERAGDAETALAYHRGVPMFHRSAHSVVLRQLAGLADEMTPWVWARWAAYQCTRTEDPGTEAAEIVRAALGCAVELFHQDDLTAAYDAGGDPVRVIARAAGEDWAFHQLCTYEFGGLAEFLDSFATARLEHECGLAQEWVGARMGGYRLESSGPAGLVVRDLADDRMVSLLDLGAHVHAGLDGWLIGRLVPSGTEPTLMFDTRPLPVNEQTARRCADDGAPAAWVAALDDAFNEGRLDRSILFSEDRELVTDVPCLGLVERGTPRPALAQTMHQLAQGRDEVGRASLRILRAAGEGSLGELDAAYVAAAVVNPHAWGEAERLAMPGRAVTWRRWAELVPDPARGRLLRLARRAEREGEAA
ncbi:hypothetical protein [Nocardioides ferulae]|uniref:hypothetical protein n=1 Tax=Nocardioides ferulae TaxID=2340821 RepID=UPI000EAE888A|nr:hypothetical protein [Nocardioides ferulae]